MEDAVPIKQQGKREVIVDFGGMLNSALSLFHNQAKKAMSPSVRAGELEEARSKSRNFMDSIVSTHVVQHMADIMEGSSESFKRADELRTLNTLRHQCDLQAMLGMKHTEMCMHTVDKLYREAQVAETSEDSLNKIQAAQVIMDGSVSTTQKLVNSLGRLIQLERLSGNRPFGISQVTSAASQAMGPVNIVQSFGEFSNSSSAQGKNGKATICDNAPAETKRISQEELNTLLLESAREVEDMYEGEEAS